MKNLYKNLIAFCTILLALLSFHGCENTSNEPTDQVEYLQIPPHFPELPVPDDNPITAAKVHLGRKLFYEPLLSPDGSIKSCSHCMKHEYAFCDGGKKNSKGYGGEMMMRNTMSLVNVAYRDVIHWDGKGSRIEEPAYRSIFLPPVFGSDTNDIEQKLQNHPTYPLMFKEAFGDDKVEAYRVALAISAFVRTFISGNSAYDKYILGDANALDESQKRGMDLFFSDKTRCSACHSGFLFTDLKFHNTGTVTHYFDRGLFYRTGKNADRGKFLTPSLRNVQVTFPYMHDGEIETLAEVIEHYNRGGVLFINKDTLMRPLGLSSQDKIDLENFLKSLTDWEFLNNEKFSDPN
ncbi:MAG: cytochrome-c peroxidase [Candidatus Kapaibacterium sp.]